MLLTLLTALALAAPTATKRAGSADGAPKIARDGAATTVEARTAPGVTPATLASTSEEAWATFPTTRAGKSITATVKCRNGIACSVYDGNTKIGAATIQPIQTGGFTLNSSLSDGGLNINVAATWMPEKNIADMVKLTP